jgi:hypothetical protein
MIITLHAFYVFSLTFDCDENDPWICVLLECSSIRQISFQEPSVSDHSSDDLHPGESQESLVDTTGSELSDLPTSFTQHFEQVNLFFTLFSISLQQLFVHVTENVPSNLGTKKTS